MCDALHQLPTNDLSAIKTVDHYIMAMTVYRAAHYTLSTEPDWKDRY